MTSVEHKAGDFVIDAALLADALNLTDVEVGQQMRIGAISSRCEMGVGEDAGKWPGRRSRSRKDPAGL